MNKILTHTFCGNSVNNIKPYLNAKEKTKRYYDLSKERLNDIMILILNYMHY